MFLPFLKSPPHFSCQLALRRAGCSRGGGGGAEGRRVLRLRDALRSAAVCVCERERERERGRERERERESG
jgi:hypothetical protein